MLSYAQRRYILTLPPYLLALIYAVLASYGVLSGGAWGIVGIAGALLMALLVGVGQRRMPMPSRNAMIFAALGVGSTALSCFMAVDPAQAWHTTLKMLTIFLPLLFLSAPSVQAQGVWVKTRLDLWAMLLIISLLILSITLAFAYRMWGPLDHTMTYFNRGFSYSIMLLIPLLASLFLVQKRRRLVWILLATCVLALYFTSSRASQLGVVAAVTLFVLARIKPILADWALKVGTVLLFVLPWCVSAVFARVYENLSMLPVSWQHRMEIWDNLSWRIADNIVFGQGIGNAEKLGVSGPHVSLYQMMDAPAAHPHNAAMQLWVETGALGVAFGLFTCFWALGGIKRLGKAFQPFAYAAYVFGLVLAMVAYNLWTDSLWCAYALTAFSFSYLATKNPEIKVSLS